MISALEALERLSEGNRRFVSGVRSGQEIPNPRRRGELLAGQQPFAIILGCSDSRVPVELVFDQGLGELFVIRVAGNITAPSQVASVEFAAQQFGSRLVLVLGHAECGAVAATLEALQHPTANRLGHFGPIVDRIRPSLESLLKSELRGNSNALMRRAVRENILASTNHLRHRSPVLQEMISRQGLQVVGAEYSLETGVVDFFEGLPGGEEPIGRRDGTMDSD